MKHAILTRSDTVDTQMHIIGLPLNTVIIGGGLFLLSTFLPMILAHILKNRKGSPHE